MRDVSKTKTVSYLVRFRKTTRGDVVVDDWKTRGRGWTARNYLPSDVCRVLKACLGMGKTGQGRYGVRLTLDELKDIGRPGVDTIPVESGGQPAEGGAQVVSLSEMVGAEVRGRVVVEVTVTRETSGVAFRKRRRKLQAGAEEDFRPEHAHGLSLIIIDEADAVPRELWDAASRVAGTVEVQNRQVRDALTEHTERGYEWCNPKGGRKG